MGKNFLGKKGAGMIIPFIVVIALVIIVAQLFTFMKRECSKDNDCKSSDEYCGSDFKCHIHPVITKTNYIPAALIAAAGFIIAALILRGKRDKLHLGSHGGEQ